MNPVSVIATQFAALAALADTGGPLDGAKIHLAQDAFTSSSALLLSSLTEATYTGYAAQPIGTFGAPYLDVNQVPRITAPGLQFQPTDDAVPNTIYGAYATNTAGTALIYSVLFDVPVPLLNALDGLIYEPDVPYGF